jgi:hypothetical protein
LFKVPGNFTPPERSVAIISASYEVIVIPFFAQLMSIIFLVLACYAIHWSVNLLTGEEELDLVKSRWLFSLGMLSIPVGMGAAVSLALA